MDFHCKVCKSRFQPRDIDKKLEIGRCQRCFAIRDLQKHFFQESNSSSPLANHIEVLRENESNIRLKRDDNSLEFSFSLLKKYHVFYFLFLVVWLQLLLSYGNWLEHAVGEILEIVVIVAFVFHLLLSLLFLYGATLLIFNRKTILCEKDRVSIHVGPIPLFPQKTIGVSFLKELTLYTRNKKNIFGQQTETFELKAINERKEEFVFVEQFNNLKELLFVQQEIKLFYQEKIRQAKANKKNKKQKKEKLKRKKANHQEKNNQDSQKNKISAKETSSYEQPSAFPSAQEHVDQILKNT